MPKVYEKIWKFIYHKDYIVGKLLNEWKEPFTDFTDASATMAFDINKLIWIEEILEETGIELEKMVKVKPSTEIVGELNEKLQKISLKKNIPILVGAGDCSAMLYGAGAVEDKTGDIYLGTTPEIDITHEELRLDSKFRLPVRSHGIKGFWYSTTTISGISINWFWNLISY
jgi:xylulokinase